MLYLRYFTTQLVLTLGITAAILVLPNTAHAQDCNNNGVPDAQDIDPGDPDGNGEVSTDCNANGVPDECDVPNANTILYAADHADGDEFGECVDVDGDTIIVGAALHSGVGADSGAAYIFRKTGGAWQEVAELTPSDETPGQLFGSSVSISGNTSVVAAPSDDDIAEDSGAVYVFREFAGVWQQIAKLKALDADAGDNFGVSISLDGDTVAIGANHADGGGAVYVFREIEGAWTQIAKVRPVEIQEGDEFGEDVDLSANTLVAGAHLRDVQQYNSGAAYVFRESDGVWSQVAELTAPNIRRNDQFGDSVSIDGDTAIVSAVGFGSLEDRSDGEAHIFRETDDAWHFVATLKSDIPNESQLAFGNAVAIHGDLAFVGGGRIPNSTYGGDHCVAVFRERDGVWRRIDHLLVPEHAGPSQSEWIAASDTTLVYGSPGSTVEGIESGFINAVDLTEQDCNNNDVPDSCELSGNDCNANGIPDDCDADCDSDGVPDDCAIANCPPGDLSCADCDGNGVPDACDPDCDDDGIPDACEIADCPPGDPTCADCDQNGVPDECEEDCNENGIPDACEVSRLRATLFAENPNYSDLFGSSVDIDGDTLVVGAANDYSGIGGAGSATIFHHVGGQWQLIATLHNPYNTGATHFGVCVSVSGNRILIGADADNVSESHAGAAYLYEFNGASWEFSAKLTSGDPSSEYFGRSLCIDGDTAIVGAIGDDEFGSSSGAAFVFREVNGEWQQIAKLTSDTAAENDQFGYCVSLSGNTAVVSAIATDEVGENKGAAYVFRESDGSWEQIQTLIPPNLDGLYRYGTCVAIDQDVIAITAADHFSDVRLYILEDHDTRWEQTGYYSGYSRAPIYANEIVDVQGGRVVLFQSYLKVYQYSQSVIPYILSDVVHIFEQTDGIWQRLALLDLGPTDSMSYLREQCAAISGDTVVVGLPEYDSVVSTTGAAFVFHLADLAQDCDGDGIPDECLICEHGQSDWGCVRCGTSSLPRVCAQMFYDCNDNSFADHCGTLPLDRLAAFVTAVVSSSMSDYALCEYDLDHNGFLDGRDINRFVDGVLDQ